MVGLDSVSIEAIEDLQTRFIVAKPSSEGRESAQTDNGDARGRCGSSAVLIEVLSECESAAGQFEITLEYVVEKGDTDTGDLSHVRSLNL